MLAETVLQDLRIGLRVLPLAIAAVAGNGIQNTLFGVSARDPLTYGSVAVLVAIVSLTATLVPARRATARRSDDRAPSRIK
jgi:putative ABC transport system permease protein